MRIAKDLKIGDTFKRQGFTFTVVFIEIDKYKNGTDCINVICDTNNNKLADSSFNFKLSTKI
jgi:hypothetical protein